MARTRRHGDTPDPVAAPPREPYWLLSQKPLQSLFFLLPLILLYELGMILHASNMPVEQIRHIFARSLLRDFFEMFGASGYHMPGLLCVGVLITLHFTHRDKFEFDPPVYFWMAVESLLFALPLFVFGMVLFSAPAKAMLAVIDGHAWQLQLLHSIGAGIYEELLFRLIAIALLHGLFVNVIALPDKWGAVLAIVLSAIAFSLYHFSKDNPFDWAKCLYFTGAGIYLACVYVARGFGIVAGAHAAYDVLIMLLYLSQGR